MNVQDVKKIAAERGIKSGKMKKADLIRTIQKEEGNLPCYDTGVAGNCGESDCLWKEDCR